MKVSKQDYKDALDRLEGNHMAIFLFNDLIDKHFEMIDHMKRTSI